MSSQVRHKLTLSLCVFIPTMVEPPGGTTQPPAASWFCNRITVSLVNSQPEGSGDALVLGPRVFPDRSMGIPGSQIGGTYHIRPICKGYVRESAQNMAIFFVQDLHFRILEFPFNRSGPQKPLVVTHKKMQKKVEKSELSLLFTIWGLHVPFLSFQFKRCC